MPISNINDEIMLFSLLSQFMYQRNIQRNAYFNEGHKIIHGFISYFLSYAVIFSGSTPTHRRAYSILICGEKYRSPVISC